MNALKAAADAVVAEEPGLQSKYDALHFRHQRVLALLRDLIDQVGKLKLMLLGKFENGHEAWSRADFINLQKKLPSLINSVKIVLKNLKHYKVNETAYRKNEIKYEDFVQAEKEMISVVQQLSEQIVYSYDLQDLKKLILAAKPLLKDSVKLPDNLDEIFEVAGAAKVALTGDKGSQMTAKNIQLLLNVGIRVYSNYVEFANFINVFKLEEKEFEKIGKDLKLEKVARRDQIKNISD